MKRLHKKIGVGVLVAGLLLGAGGLGGSVAHANKISDEEAERILISEISNRLNPKQKSVLDRVYVRQNSFIGKRFHVLDGRNMIDGKDSIKLSDGSKIDNVKRLKNVNSGLEDLKDIILKARSASFVKLVFEEEKLEIVLIVF